MGQNYKGEIATSLWNCMDGKMLLQDLDMLILPPTYDKRVPEQLLKTLLEALRTKVTPTSITLRTCRTQLSG